MNAIDYSLAFHSAISKRKDKNWYCADPNWKMAVESLALCGKFCLLAAKDKTYFMDRQAGNQAHNFQSAFRNRVVVEGQRSGNRMVKNQRTSGPPPRPFLERLGRGPAHCPDSSSFDHNADSQSEP